MIRSRLLIASFIGVFVYSVISFFAGMNGVFRYNHLKEEKKKVSLQLSYIQNINEELNMELTALKKDKEVIASFAKKLDYVCDDELLVKINGLKPYQSTIYETGSVLKRTSSPYLAESFCKICGVTFFGIVYILLLLVDIKKGNIVIKKSRPSIIQGIPIYDMQQI